MSEPVDILSLRELPRTILMTVLLGSAMLLMTGILIVFAPLTWTIKFCGRDPQPLLNTFLFIKRPIVEGYLEPLLGLDPFE